MLQFCRRGVGSCIHYGDNPRISLPIAEAQFCQTNIERIGGLSLFAIFSIKYYGMGPTNNLNRVKQLPVAQSSATMHDNLATLTAKCVAAKQRAGLRS